MSLSKFRAFLVAAVVLAAILYAAVNTEVLAAETPAVQSAHGTGARGPISSSPGLTAPLRPIGVGDEVHPDPTAGRETARLGWNCTIAVLIAVLIVRLRPFPRGAGREPGQLP